MPPQHQERIDTFMPPPTGTHTIADFKILAHVNLKVPKKAVGQKTSSAVLGDEDPDS
jgi:hypothetical protein